MRRIITLLILAVLLGSMLVLGVAPKTQALTTQVPCSVGTLNATYAFLTTGSTPVSTSPPVIGPVVPAQPIAAVGTITFNGQGGVSAVYTGQTAGIAFSASQSGTYAVNPDCTGSINFTTSGSTAFGEHFNLVIVENAKQVQIIANDVFGNTNSGVAILGVGQGCSVATLNGTYGFRTTGMAIGNTPTSTGVPVPVAAVGTVTFDGLGGIPRVAFTANINGITQTPNPFVSSGNYTVNSDCTGSMGFASIQGVGTNFNLVTLGNASQFLMISQTGTTDSGVAIFHVP